MKKEKQGNTITEISNIAKKDYQKKERIPINEKTRQNLIRRDAAIKQIQNEMQSILQTILEMNQVDEKDLYNISPNFTELILALKEGEKS